jgi:hypothetical protein
MPKIIYMVITFLFFNTFSFATHAEVLIKNYNYKDYKTAKSATTTLRFESKSTKLGFITTDFDGVAKILSITYNLKNNLLDQVKIKIDAKNFDTDSGARNEKMNEVCLESQKFTEIIGTIAGVIDLNIKDQNITVDFIVKNQPHQMTVKFLSEKKSELYKITILGSFSLKDWNISDPSIAIAKVRDQFDLIFETIL